MRATDRADQAAREGELLLHEQVGDGARDLLGEFGGALVDGFDEDDQADDFRVAVAGLFDHPGPVLAHVALDYGEAADPDTHVRYLRGAKVGSWIRADRCRPARP